MVLDIKFIKWYQSEWSDRVVSLCCQICDQDCDVLFQLSKITNDVTLIEIESLLIVLLVSNTQEEFGFGKLFNHAFNLWLQLEEIFLGFISFSEVAVDFMF